ncbi:hypothetical protein [Streptomyces sp. NPDC058045]|uniref:hypothetical protein n=1 Tax=Streptomyces sp. NPDC058045 TaxID=3346311 RepID=UPI0036EC5326
MIGEVVVRDPSALRSAVEMLFARFDGGGHTGDGVLEGVTPRHTVLDLADVPEAERRPVLAQITETKLPGPPQHLVLRRYVRGGYAPPHRFADEAPDGSRSAWTVLCPLQDSAVDAVTYWAGDHFARGFDRAGTGLRLPQDAWCWTSPVRGDQRCTLGIGGGTLWTS